MSSLHLLKGLCYRSILTTGNSLLTPIKGIIFDMDGTLTVPVLNFSQLKEKLGISDEVDVLDYASNASDVEKIKIDKILNEFEKEGSKNLQLQPSLHKLFYFLNKNNISTALITRNKRDAVDAFITKFVQEDKKELFKKESDIFSIIITREFIPVKPDPASAHHVSSYWNIPEEHIVFVGDDIKDIECGKTAGCATVLMHKHDNCPSWKEIADLNVDSLEELYTLLQSPFDVKRTAKQSF